MYAKPLRKVSSPYGYGHPPGSLPLGHGRRHAVFTMPGIAIHFGRNTQEASGCRGNVDYMFRNVPANRPDASINLSHSSRCSAVRTPPRSCDRTRGGVMTIAAQCLLRQ